MTTIKFKKKVIVEAVTEVNELLDHPESYLFLQEESKLKDSILNDGHLTMTELRVMEADRRNRAINVRSEIQNLNLERIKKNPLPLNSYFIDPELKDHINELIDSGKSFTVKAESYDRAFFTSNLQNLTPDEKLILDDCRREAINRAGLFPYFEIQKPSASDKVELYQEDTKSISEWRRANRRIIAILNSISITMKPDYATATPSKLHGEYLYLVKPKAARKSKKAA